MDLGFDDSGDFTQEQATTSADPIAAVEPSRDSLDDFLSGASGENKGADDGGQEEGPLRKGGIFLDEEDEDGFDGFGEGGEGILGGQDDEDGGDEVFGVPSRSAAKVSNTQPWRNEMFILTRAPFMLENKRQFQLQSFAFTPAACPRRARYDGIFCPAS